ncbi:MAG: hypothetical protein ACRDD7_16640 [Peptostreptococcaceae bacterium]
MNTTLVTEYTRIALTGVSTFIADNFDALYQTGGIIIAAIVGIKVFQVVWNKIKGMDNEDGIKQLRDTTIGALAYFYLPQAFHVMQFLVEQLPIHLIG